MKKIICLMLALSIAALSACDGGIVGNNMEEPPQATVMTGEIKIIPVINKIADGLEDTHISHLDSALNVEIPAVSADAEFIMDAGKIMPETIRGIYEDYVISPEEIKPAYSGELIITEKDGKYSFTTDKNEQCHIRLFVITATWDELTAEYIFAVRYPESITEGYTKDEFPVECEYFTLSAEYDKEHSHIGGTHFFTDKDSFGNFVTQHGISFGGNEVSEEMFMENNAVVVYDYDSVTPEYLSPEVKLSSGRIDVKKQEKYSGKLDATVSVRGYVVFVGKDVCEVFDITDSSDVYYSW